MMMIIIIIYPQNPLLKNILTTNISCEGTNVFLVKIPSPLIAKILNDDRYIGTLRGSDTQIRNDCVVFVVL
jgi:hypothetical protein